MQNRSAVTGGTGGPLIAASEPARDKPAGYTPGGLGGRIQTRMRHGNL